ncbi:SGNH hydrolase-type esterase domain-containing protein, partial [Chytriomyces sp. MP71]
MVLIGDSLTEFGNQAHGWGATIAEVYSRRMDVMFRGFSGYNSHWLKLALPGLLRGLGFGRQSPSHGDYLFTLLIGTNDSRNASTPQHVPLETYRKNVKEIVSILHAGVANTRILLLTPPPSAALVTRHPFYFRTLRAYRDACLDAIAEMHAEEAWFATQVAVLDLWELFVPGGEFDEDAFDPEAVLGRFFHAEDKLHFSLEGHAFVAKSILAVIAKEWPEYAVDQL